MNAANFAFHALQNMTAPSAFDPVLVDAWRASACTVEECLRFIAQHSRVIAERNQRLSTGTLVHSRKYVWQCRGDLVRDLERYRAAVRRVSECEIEMEGIGMAYALSSHDWRVS